MNEKVHDLFHKIGHVVTFLAETFPSNPFVYPCRDNNKTAHEVAKNCDNLPSERYVFFLQGPCKHCLTPSIPFLLLFSTPYIFKASFLVPLLFLSKKHKKEGVDSIRFLPFPSRLGSRMGSKGGAAPPPSSVVCCMCGDRGLMQELFRCKLCLVRSQHRSVAVSFCCCIILSCFKNCNYCSNLKPCSWLFNTKKESHARHVVFIVLINSFSATRSASQRRSSMNKH